MVVTIIATTTISCSNGMLQKEQDLTEFIHSLNDQEQTILWDDLSTHVVNATINATAETTITESSNNNQNSVSSQVNTYSIL